MNKRLTHFLQVFLLTLFFSVFDPFSSASNSERLSEALFYRIIAPLYPQPGDPAVAVPRWRLIVCHLVSLMCNTAIEEADRPDPFSDNSEIAVVIINDESLAELEVDPKTHGVRLKGSAMDEEPSAVNDICSQTDGAKNAGPEDRDEYQRATWPPALAIHARILCAILASSRPKAIYVDFGFFDERDSGDVDVLAQVLRTYALTKSVFEACAETTGGVGGADCAAIKDQHGQTNRVPIFLTGLGEEAPGGLSVLPALAEKATGLVSARYIGDVIETYNEYEMVDCETGQRSAAVAMYLTGHGRGGLPEYRCVDDVSEPRLSVFWAMWGSKDYSRGYYGCRYLPGSVLGRLLTVTLGVIPTGDVQSHARDQLQACPPHLTASASQILADTTGIGAVMDGRYVFFGGNFVMADDLIHPPTHRPVPGVYVHAMVLDNLLRREFKLTESAWVSWGLTLLAMAVAAACSAWAWAKFDRNAPQSDNLSVHSPKAKRYVCNFARASASTHRTGRWTVTTVIGAVRNWWRSIAWIVAGLILCAVLLTGMTIVAFFAADLAPINVLGILALIGLDAGVHALKELVERMV